MWGEKSRPQCLFSGLQFSNHSGSQGKTQTGTALFFYKLTWYLGHVILSYVDKNTGTLRFAWAFIIIWIDTLGDPVLCWREYRHRVSGLLELLLLYGWILRQRNPVLCWQEYGHRVLGLLELLLLYGWSRHYWRRCQLQGLLLLSALWTGCIQMLSLFLVVVVVFVPVFLYIYIFFYHKNGCCTKHLERILKCFTEFLIKVWAWG